MQHTTQRPATESGTLTIGGDLTIYHLGFGTMRLTGPGRNLATTSFTNTFRNA